MIRTSQFGQSKSKVQRSTMTTKIQLLAIILVISITVGYAKGPRKIIMGETAAITEFPHQVSLQTRNGLHFCGGSIIGAEFILTAAHCIVDESGISMNDDIYVVIGTNDLELNTSTKVFRVVRRICHKYDSKFHKNDIAVLQLNKPIVFNNWLKPAKLPQEDVPAGTRVMSSGWGATTYNSATKTGDNYPRYLQKLERFVVRQQLCENYMRDYKVGPSQICVFSLNGADTCSGDSGGPLTYNGTVIGITSYGLGCGKNHPDIYTRVHYYLRWIEIAQWYMSRKLKLPSDAEDFVEV